MNYLKSYLKYEIFFMYFLHLLRFSTNLVEKISYCIIFGLLLSPKSAIGQDFLNHGATAAIVILAFTVNQFIRYLRHNDRLYRIETSRFEKVVISFFCILSFSAAYSSGIENSIDLSSFLTNNSFIYLMLILVAINFINTKIIPKIQLSIVLNHVIADHLFTLNADVTDTRGLYQIADEFADRLVVERVIRTISHYRDSKEIEGITDEIVIRLKLDKRAYETVPFFTYLNYSNRFETVTIDREVSESSINLETAEES